MNIEVIKNCKTVLIHQVKSAESIADCMLEMIKNYNNFTAHSASTREIAIDKFDIKKIAVKYEEYFAELSNK